MLYEFLHETKIFFLKEMEDLESQSQIRAFFEYIYLFVCLNFYYGCILRSLFLCSFILCNIFLTQSTGIFCSAEVTVRSPEKPMYALIQ